MMLSLKFIRNYLPTQSTRFAHGAGSCLCGVPNTRTLYVGQALKIFLGSFVPSLSGLNNVSKFLVISSLIFLTACASSGKKNITANVESEQIEIPAEAAQKFSVAIQSMGAGKTDLAEKQLIDITKQYPQLSGPHANLGVIYSQKKEWDKAEQSLNTAVERNKRNAKAYNQLGFVYRQKGKFKEAEAAYLKAISIDPKFQDAYLNMGILSDLYLGKMERAVKYYSKYQAMQGKPNRQVAGWLVDINRRLGVQAKAKSQVASGGQ